MMTSEEYDQLYPDALKSAIKDMIHKFDVEQKPLREYHLKEYKKMDFYWQGLQNIFWAETARDWRPYQEGLTANPDLDVDEDDIGRIVNVYRAYGESIIAGLSAAIPGVRFAPDDADNIDDVSTAKAYSKIADLVNIHNNAPTKLIQALFILYNQPFVAAYNYYDTSDEYGTKKVPGPPMPMMQTVNQETCPNCGTDLQAGDNYCPVCDQNVIPQVVPQEQEVLIPTKVDCPKSREIIEFYGALNVKIPFYVKCLKNSPYLILEAEYHVSIAKELYPWIKDKIKPTRSYSDYEKWVRQPSEAYMNPDSEVVTIRRAWLRPAAYSTLDPEIEQQLREQYPNGAYVAFVDDILAEIIDESMDDHWTVTESPISQYIHATPLGRPMIDVQDMTNDMFNLTLRSIQYGIPMTFVSADAIDWDKWKESPSEPGLVYPIKVPSGTSADSMFSTVKVASVSQEVDRFMIKLESAGQLVSGAFPSIYGGTMQGGGKTFKEYDASRSQALQRLGITWKMINVWWKDFIFKACKEYARNLQSDESYAQRTGESYVNVWIRKAELAGKVGDVEAETSDQFPISMVQKRGLLLELMNMNNPMVNQALFHTENVGNNARLLGFGELYIPGEDQRNKQLSENLELMKTQPIPTAQIDQMGQPIMQSSIPIEPVDDDQIHIETSTAFLVSDMGRYLKTENPAGYQNVLLHMQMHQQSLQMKQQAMMTQQLQLQQMQKIQSFPPNRVNYNVSELSGGGSQGQGKVQ